MLAYLVQAVLRSFASDLRSRTTSSASHEARAQHVRGHSTRAVPGKGSSRWTHVGFVGVPSVPLSPSPVQDFELLVRYFVAGELSSLCFHKPSGLGSFASETDRPLDVQRNTLWKRWRRWGKAWAGLLHIDEGFDPVSGTLGTWRKYPATDKSVNARMTGDVVTKAGALGTKRFAMGSS